MGTERTSSGRAVARRLSLVAGAGMLLCATGAGALEARDECIDAVPISRVQFEETVDSRTATTGPQDPLQSCSAGGPNRNTNSFWYRYVAPATGTLSVAALTVPFPGTPQTVITVYAGGCAALRELACADSLTRDDTRLVTRVNAEATYWIEVATEAGAEGGAMSVRLALDPDSAICPSAGGTFVKAAVNLVGLGLSVGDERLKITARVAFPEPLSPRSADGLQLLLHSFVPEYATLAEWSARTIAIPAGGLGTGCDPRDGWTTSKNGASRRYRNFSNALPPACARGSANGLTEVRLLRKSTDWRVVDVKVRAKNMRLLNLPTSDDLQGDLVWLSATLGSTLGSENADRCANTRPALRCVHNGKGTATTCKLPRALERVRLAQ